MNSDRSRGTRTHDQIRLDILHGKWAPGEKLQPVSLSAVYKTSTTVVREALTRLAGEGFVSIEPNRGFFMRTLSLSELRDITEVRCRMEELGVTLAVGRGDLKWESELTAVHHQLSRTPRRGADDPQHVADEWSRVHEAFHAKIIEASGVPVLTNLCRHLWESTELYRRWAAPLPKASTRDVESEHAEILEAVLDRDADRAATLLREHYETTVNVILNSGLVKTGQTEAIDVVAADF